MYTISRPWCPWAENTPDRSGPFTSVVTVAFFCRKGCLTKTAGAVFARAREVSPPGTDLAHHRLGPKSAKDSGKSDTYER